MKTRPIIFGMDGVIVDSEKLAYRVLKEMLKEQNHMLTPEFFYKVQGVNQEMAEQLFPQEYPGIDGKRIYEDFYRRYYQALTAGELEAKPGFFSLLDELDRRGIKRAVASSRKFMIVRATLRCLGVYNRFDALVCTEMVKRVKPYPDLFLKAAEMLTSPPGQCLVLESNRAGVLAAAAAKIPVILIPDRALLSRGELKICLHKFDRLDRVIDFISASDKVSTLQT